MNTKKISHFVYLSSILIKRDLRVRYRGSWLGYLWSMVTPLLQMSILAFVFSHIMRFKVDDFPLFILSGVVVWNLFHQSMSAGVHSITNNSGLIKKVKLSVALFPVVSVGSVLVNFILSLLTYILISMAYGRSIGVVALTLPLLLLPYMGFTLGAVLLVSALNTKFRDIGHILEPVLSLVFYATPIIYPLSLLPEFYQELAWLNPVMPFVSGFRDILYGNKWPGLESIALMYGTSFVMLTVGWLTYRKYREKYIYYV